MGRAFLVWNEGGGGGFLQVFVTLVIQSGSDTHIYREPLAGMTLVYASHWGDIAVIAAVGDPNVLKSDRDT